MPAAFRVNQSHATPIDRSRRNTRTPARYDSSQSFADSAHDPDASDSYLRASTPLMNSPRPAAPRRDSQAHLDAIRKRPRAPIKITSAASRTRLAVRGAVIGQRVTWSPSAAVNCCALSVRHESPPAHTPARSPHGEERASGCNKQLAGGCDEWADVRCGYTAFSFEPCAIAAFARDTAAHEWQDTAPRNYVRQPLHTGLLVSSRGVNNDVTATASAAHDTHDSARHIITDSRREANYSFQLAIENSALRNRRCHRLLPRVSSSSSFSNQRPFPISDTSSAPDPIAAITASSISAPMDSSEAAAAAHSTPSPMDPFDAAEVFNTAAFGFIDFRAASEVLRSCATADIVIRGLDAQFRREIEAIGCDSVRGFLRSRFAKLPESLRALYEDAIIDCRETVPAMTFSNSGRREQVSLCCLHVHSYCAALAVAELFRREFAARPESETPQILVTAHGLGWPAEIAPTPASSASAGAPALNEPAGPTPPDSGIARPCAPFPPVGASRVFGSGATMPPLSFTTAKSAADAAAAAAALAASNAAERAERTAQGVYSPQPFPERTARPLAALHSSSASIEPSSAAASAPVPPPPTGPPLSAPTGPDTTSKSMRRADKRHPTSPLQSCNAKRPAETGSSANNPMIVDSPEKLAAVPPNRFSAFELDRHAYLGKPGACARYRGKRTECRIDCERSSRVRKPLPDSASVPGTR